MPRLVLCLTALMIAVPACSSGTNNQTVGSVRLQSGDDSAAAEPGLVDIETNNSTPSDSRPKVDAENTANIEPIPVFLNGEQVNDKGGLVVGNISQTSQTDTYQFQVEAGDFLVLEQLSGCTVRQEEKLEYLWMGREGEFEIDPDTGTCDTRRRATTGKAGSAELIVNGTDRTGGEYSFRLILVTQPMPVQLEVGEEVRPGSPLGAGKISHPYERDIYNFSLVKGKTYTIRGLGGCQLDKEGTHFSFSVSGTARASGTLKSVAKGDCTDSESFVANETGPATLEVFHFDLRSTGNYSLIVEQT